MAVGTNRRRGWRVRRVASMAAAIACVLVVLAAVFSQTALFRSWLRAQTVTRLSAALAARVALGGLEGNLFRRLVLTDVRITLEGARVLAARRVVADYDLLALLTRRRVRLTAVTVDGLALRLVEDARGWNVKRLGGPPKATPPEEDGGVEVVLERVRIHGGALKVVRRGALWGFRDLALVGAAELAGGGQRITLAALSGTLVRHALGIEELSGRLVVTADGAVAADDVTLRTDASSLHGRVRVGSGPAAQYDVDADITHLSAAELRRFTRATVPLADISGTVRARGPAAAVTVETALASTAGEVGLRGSVDLAHAPAAYDLGLTLTHLDTAALLGPGPPVTDLNGTLAVTGSGTTLEEAAGTVALALRDSRVAGTTLAELAIQGKVAARTVEFDASAATPTGKAQAGGTVSVAEERYDVWLSAAELDPAPYLNRPDLTARVNGTVTLAGTGFALETARAKAELVLAPSRIGAIEIRAARADLRADAGWLTIERLTLASSVGDAEAAGSLALAALAPERAPQPSAPGAGAGAHAGGAPASAGGGGKARARAAPSVTRGAERRGLERRRDNAGFLRYGIRVADVQPLAALAGAGSWRGRAAIEGSASGSLRALDVRASCDARELLRGAIAIDMLHGEVEARAIGTPSAAAEVRAHAEGMRAGGRRFAALDLHGSWAGEGGGSGRADLEVQVREDARHRHDVAVTADLRPGGRRVEIRSLRLDVGGETWVADGQPLLVQRGDRVTIERFALRSASGQMRVEGSTGTSGTQDLALTVDGLDLRFLEPTLGERLEGRLSGAARLSGTAALPELAAEVAIEAPAVGASRYQALRARLQAAAGSATVAARIIQGGDRQLTLDAALPVQLSLAPVRVQFGAPLSGHLRASGIALAFLEPLVPQVAKLAGTLDADLALDGALAAPAARGTLAISGARAYVIPLGLTYDPIELRARLDGRALQIETLSIASGRGTLTGGGHARLETDADAAAIDVRFALAEFPLFANEYGHGAASGAIWVTGSTAAPVVEGRLETDGFVLQIPEALPGTVRPPDPTITVVGPGAPASPAPPVKGGAEPPPTRPPAVLGLYERAAVTVQLDVPRNAWIRRSDANIELRGWMTGWKRPAEQLRLTGEINAVRGWYSFQGKKFTLAEGQVTFTGEGFDPLLNLVAAHSAAEYTVRVRVGGTITKPALALESDPSLEQSDILSVLLFGRPTSQLSRSESTGLREQTISVAGSYVASELRQSVADALGLDNLEFDSGAAGLADAKVSIGKYVAQDIFVSIAHRFGRQSVDEVRIEYQLTPQSSLETSSDTLGDSGIDVFWKRRY